MENSREQIVYSTKPRLTESFGYKVNAVAKPLPFDKEIVRVLCKAGWFSRYSQPSLQPRAGGLRQEMCGKKDKILQPYHPPRNFGQAKLPSRSERTEERTALGRQFGLTV